MHTKTGRRTFYHIGIHYLQPFRPTFRKCQLASPEDAAAAVDVLATNQYSTLFAAVQGLDVSRTWYSRLFYLREGNIPLPVFDPSRVVMVPYQAGDHKGYQLWPHPGRGKSKKRPDEADDDADDECGNPEEADSDQEDPAITDNIVCSRALSALLEESVAALQDHAVKPVPEPEGSAKSEEADPEDDPGADPPKDSPNTSDISLTPLSAGACSGSSNSDTDPVSDRDDADAMPAASAAHSDRGHAGSVLEVPGGVIRFYDKGADHPKYFVAVCSNHHNCVRTRQATASKQSTKTPNCAAKGRPLGQLVAWLAMGQRAAVDSKAKHWKTSAVEEYCTHAVRLDQRFSLEVLDGGLEMLAHERPTRDGEGDEPAGLA